MEVIRVASIWESSKKKKKKTQQQQQFHIPGGSAEEGATIKDLKDAEMVVYTTSPFNSSI